MGAPLFRFNSKLRNDFIFRKKCYRPIFFCFEIFKMKRKTLTKTPTKTEKKKEKKRKTKFIDLNQTQLESFSSFDWKANTNVASINASNNLIKDFTNFPWNLNIKNLVLDNNPIESFLGAQSLPTLKNLSLKKCKIAQSTHFKLMCLIVFGSQIMIINDDRVPEPLRQHADSLRSSVFEQLTSGQILIKTNPVKLVSVDSTNPKVRRNQEEENNEERKSFALLCNQILENEIPINKHDAKRFMRKFKRIQRKYYLPVAPIFDKNEQFSSEASFTNPIEFRRIQLPPGIVISDYYYSESSEDQYSNRSISCHSVSSTDDSSSCLSD